jgi:hypothetical protein
MISQVLLGDTITAAVPNMEPVKGFHVQRKQRSEKCQWRKKIVTTANPIAAVLMSTPACESSTLANVRFRLSKSCQVFSMHSASPSIFSVLVRYSSRLSSAFWTSAHKCEKVASLLYLDSSRSFKSFCMISFCCARMCYIIANSLRRSERR